MLIAGMWTLASRRVISKSTTSPILESYFVLEQMERVKRYHAQKGLVHGHLRNRSLQLQRNRLLHNTLQICDIDISVDNLIHGLLIQGKEVRCDGKIADQSL